MVHSVSLGELHVSSGNLDEIRDSIARDIASGGKTYCVPLNVTKYSMAKSDSKLRAAIRDAKYVTADGLPITWLSKKVGHERVERVTGIDLSEACLQLAARDNLRLFFFGTKEETGQQALINLRQKYGNLNIVGYRNGFFTDADVPRIIEQINQAQPDILFLGLGLPQKEYFIHDHFSELDVRFCITVGGAIDIWANVKKRAPALVQRCGMEWLYRSLSNLRKTTDLVAHVRVFAMDYFIRHRSLNQTQSPCDGNHKS